MADIFISYSRKDSEFGRRLHTKLTEEKRDTWMDWEDIPATVEWWDKIRDGILTSDNIIFIISPQSIASPICNLEIDYARELNKRILPILYEDTDESKAFVELVTKPLNDFQRALLQGRDLLAVARDNWRFLAGLNWIDFKADAEFEKKAQELLKAVSTDFEYVDEHTRLLVWESDWENRKRSPSLLLHGDDLIAAEDWLKGAEGKAPLPTQFHQDYIQESRCAEDERQRQAKVQARRIKQFRLATTGLAAMVVLAVIVSIFAGMTTINAISTQATVEFRSTYSSLELGWAATLAAGGVIRPVAEHTQESVNFIATVTQIAVLNGWQPVIQEFYGVEMVKVPEGCFFMGSIFIFNAQPIHEVCFSNDFWIDRYEEHGSAGTPRLGIEWQEARNACDRRDQNMDDGRREDVRLPTEAEWEYAARGPNSYAYPWGNEFLEDKAGWIETTGGYPGGYTTVGSWQEDVSWVGAMDMSGNVKEWVSTAYGLGSSASERFPYPYNRDDGREDLERYDVLRVVRGGDYLSSDEINLRSASRSGEYPFVSKNSNDRWERWVGFRCARSDS